MPEILFLIYFYFFNSSYSVNIELSFGSWQVYGLRICLVETVAAAPLSCFWTVSEHFIWRRVICSKLQIKLSVCLRVSRGLFWIWLNQTDLSVLTCYRRQHCRRCCLFSHVVDATTQKERNTTSFLHIRPYMTIRLYNMTLRLLGWYIYIYLL